MEYALSVAQVRAAEQAAVEAGASLAELMDAAGAAVSMEARALAPEGPVVVLAGKGNNGGDGWVAARLLHEHGVAVRVVSVCDPEELPSPAKEAAASATGEGVEWSSPADPVVPDAVLHAELIVDALLGVGSAGPPRDAYADLVEMLFDSEAGILSIDLPSGVEADTGHVHGAAVLADVTVTMGGIKQGLVLPPGREYAGEIIVADIGLPDEPAPAGALEMWDWGEYADILTLPMPEDHKGSRGRVLVAGGSPGMLGAVSLAANGALRSGAGYVVAAVPAELVSALEATLVPAVKRPLPWKQAGGADVGYAEAVLEAAENADAVVLGSGVGRLDSTVEAVLQLISRIASPLVLDADGLYAAAIDPEVLWSRAEPCIITPHAGEAASLLRCSTAEVLSDRPAAARALTRGRVSCLLKGAGTLISSEGRLVMNMTGNPGLATLGVGDVLAGVVGTFLAQGSSPLEAAALAAYLHGMAGDVAAAVLTPVCCTATDVITYLPDAVRMLLEGPGPDSDI